MRTFKAFCGLLFSFTLISWSVFAHGPESEHGGAQRIDSTGVVPAYLAASVCGMPGREGDLAFERRVQLVQLIQATLQQDDQSAPSLSENLGDRTFPITTRVGLAQRYFDQGLRWTYAFNHPEALRAFRHAQDLDPACAMCYWGEAYVLGPNINAPMDPEAVAPALAALEQAWRYSETASEREKALITALFNRYSPDPNVDRNPLDIEYADAMGRVAARYPDNVDIAALYADAQMNISPWDYWQTDGTTLKPQVANLVKTLEEALARDPAHPYAIHLYIHAVEASNTPERAEPYADRLGEQMPGAGHIVHMPSHIYFRIGRFIDSIEQNKNAVAADEGYLANASTKESLYQYSYYPHNVHFLLESARMAGDGETALAAAAKLPTVMSDDVAAELPWVQLIKAAPFFAYAEFGDPEQILAVRDPGDRFPYVKAMWHYAQAVTHAARGDTDAARLEADMLTQIRERASFDDLIAGAVPAPELVDLARNVVEARIAQAEGKYETAAEEFRKAEEIQNTLPYLEPPYWYYPVEQSLGAALLQAGEYSSAEQAFRQALEAYPNRAWTLYGLREALTMQGKKSEAMKTDMLLRSALAGNEMPKLSQL